MRAFRLFLVSFLVLFLQVALIRWMPAYVRLLAYFSNFILLATFLGAGLGCLLARSRWNLFAWFPVLQLAVILAVKYLRLEVAVPSTTSIYFSSGTAEKIVPVESTLLLPLLFLSVAALFVAVAHRMGRELAGRPPLKAYAINLLGSLAGVAAFAFVSWLQLPPSIWFSVASAAALPLLATSTLKDDARPRVAQAFRPAGQHRGSPGLPYGNLATRSRYAAHARWATAAALLAVSIAIVRSMERDSLWSPYYRITLRQDGPDTVVEVNNIFHQSMAPVDQKEYFYQWPYTVFGDTFDEVLILGAGSGTDVAAALRHGAKHVDAVEIDPIILRLGAELHPDRPYNDPRVRTINDDARHFLATTTKKYDLIVFALIDSLTVQSSFSGVRLESYMFTEESFAEVRDHLTPRGVMALYNYFREKWLVDRLANTATHVFGHDPLAHVHQERAYLGVMLAGPRVGQDAPKPPLPTLVMAYGQARDPNPARPLERDASVVPASDNWPFLYMREPALPAHYLSALGIVLSISIVAVFAAAFFQSFPPGLQSRAPSLRWPAPGPRSLQFFFLGVGFMLLETKSIVQFALLWGSTWSSASLAIASVLVMALASAVVVSQVAIRRRAPIVVVLVVLLAVNYLIPVGRISFDSRTAESLFYGALVFSPVLCAGLIFSSSYKESSSTASDFGANLLGAMVGGVAEYLSLLAGYRFLLLLVGVMYLLAVTANAATDPTERTETEGTEDTV